MPEAKALVRAQLANGPKPEEDILADADFVAIPGRTLIAAADALGVRTRRGQWWLPWARGVPRFPGAQSP